ncbi:MAG: alanine racemase, partial [Sphingomonadaceae bacterium]|nr:alanine racemase [Sphingomonadaceae bacterium]
MVQTTPSLNAHLLHIPGGRRRLNTPALILDLDLLEANIAQMARLCAEKNIALRPHAKTHKSIEIAKRQLQAGAVGICCAKLGEAEVLAAGGIGSVLVTSPVVTAEGCRRLAALNKSCPDLMIVTDSAANVPDLAAAGAASGRPLKVLVDLDVGQHRTGIAPGDSALALAEAIAATPHLSLAGIQGYAGHLQHLHGRAERRSRTLAAMALLAETRAALEARGHGCAIVTGGGTGTFDLDPGAATLTDLQAGSYIFMDAQYAEVWEADAERVPFA